MWLRPYADMATTCAVLLLRSVVIGMKFMATSDVPLLCRIITIWPGAYRLLLYRRDTYVHIPRHVLPAYAAVPASTEGPPSSIILSGKTSPTVLQQANG